MMKSLLLFGTAYLFFFAQASGACLLVSYTARCFDSDIRIVALGAALLVVVAFWLIEKNT
jgi:hypothetical protein